MENKDGVGVSRTDAYDDDFETNLGCACIGPTLLAIIIVVVLAILAIKHFL